VPMSVLGDVPARLADETGQGRLRNKLLLAPESITPVPRPISFLPRAVLCYQLNIAGDFPPR
jgi:hypothetical protein